MFKNRKKLFLHIGFNKTGSTYIQNCLVANADRLKRLGFLYPSAPGASYLNNNQHVPLAVVTTGASLHWMRVNPHRKLGIQSAKDDLLAEVDNSGLRNVIISSEAFGEVTIGDEHVAKVLSHFREFDIWIVAYVRRQDHYIVSAYQEDIKNGSDRTFDLEQALASEQYHFFRRLKPWVKQLGGERVLIREFDRDRWVGRDLFLDFLAALGIRGDSWQLARVANEGLDIREIELLRRLNAQLKKQVSGKNAMRRRNQLRAVVLRAIRSVGSPSSARQKMRLSRSQAKRVAEEFLEENIQMLGVERGARFIQVSDEDVSVGTAFNQVECEEDLSIEVLLVLAQRILKLQKEAE